MLDIDREVLGLIKSSFLRLALISTQHYSRFRKQQIRGGGKSVVF